MCIVRQQYIYFLYTHVYGEKSSYTVVNTNITDRNNNANTTCVCVCVFTTKTNETLHDVIIYS